MHDLSQSNGPPNGKRMMTPTKLSDPEPHRVILATVDGGSDTAKLRESKLKSSIWREVRTYQFMNTWDSAWSILDTILDVEPIEMQYIRNELDRICKTLPTQFAPRPNLSFFSSLFSFRLGRSVSALSSPIFNRHLFSSTVNVYTYSV